MENHWYIQVIKVEMQMYGLETWSLMIQLKSQKEKKIKQHLPIGQLMETI